MVLPMFYWDATITGNRDRENEKWKQNRELVMKSLIGLGFKFGVLSVFIFPFPVSRCPLPIARCLLPVLAISLYFVVDLPPNTADFVKRYTGSVSCGVGRQSRIVGGVSAKPAEFPWQVGIIYTNGYGRTGIFCGGSLIDPKWVVSAAHCFQRRVSYDTAVLLGEFDVNNEEGNEVMIVAKRVGLKKGSRKRILP